MWNFVLCPLLIPQRILIPRPAYPLEDMASEGEVVPGPGTQVTRSTPLTASDQPGTSHSTSDPLLPHQAQTSSRNGYSAVTSNTGSTPSPEQPFQGLRQRNDNKPPDQVVGTARSFNTNEKSSGNDSKGTQDGVYGGTADDGSTTWSESTAVPRRNLGFLQITSLMLNATIGSGIFNTPGYVLALTRSKTISMVLWAVGGVYTGLRYANLHQFLDWKRFLTLNFSMLVFLEFGTALPFNGGALIYVCVVLNPSSYVYGN
jgi:hypothetical protein